MFTCAVMNCLPTIGQTERSVYWNEVGLRLIYRAQYFFIAECDVCLRLHAMQDAHACWTTQRSRKVDANNNEWSAV
jgi:hypothetical protein